MRSVLSYCFLLIAVALQFTQAGHAQSGGDVTVFDIIEITGSRGCGAVICGRGTTADNALERRNRTFSFEIIGTGNEFANAIMLPAGRFTRTTPECQLEDLFQKDTITDLRSGTTHNTFIMEGPFAYPAGQGWRKYQRRHVTLNPMTGALYNVINLHYEYNSITGQFTKPHFVSTASQGCNTSN